MVKRSKRWKAGLVGAASILLMLATIPLAIWVTHTATAQAGNERARCLSVAQPLHKVIIKNDKVRPSHTIALQCDTLTIINEDSQTRLMAFGPHDHHISYDGISEKAVGPGQSLTVKLVRTGTFTFHDHIDDEVQGTFTVNK